MEAPLLSYLHKHVNVLQNERRWSLLTSRHFLWYIQRSLWVRPSQFLSFQSSSFPFCFLSFSFLSKHGLQILRSTVDVLGVIRIFKGPRFVEIG